MTIAAVVGARSVVSARIGIWLVLVVAAGVRLWLGIRQLVFPRPYHYDGGDLRYRWQEVHSWFRGDQVYGAIRSADYPPGAYPVLWPFMGWTSLEVARWIWAAATLLLLLLLVWLALRECRESGWLPRTAMAAIPLAGYATYVTFANGQAGILVVTSLLAGILLLTRQNSLATDVVGSALVAVALMKPTLAVPLAWVAFLKPVRMRPAVLVVTLVAALTALGVAFQRVPPLDLVLAWLGQRQEVNLSASGPSLQKLLTSEGLDGFFLPAAMIVLIATGLWVWRHRTADVWLLIGVTAVVALLWTYHRPYDDILVLLPMIATVRATTRAPERYEKVTASALVGLLLITAIEHPLLPWMRETHGLPIIEAETIVLGLNNVRVGVWVAALVFLARQAHGEVFGRSAMKTVERSANRDVPGTTRPARWILICLGIPLAVLTGAYAWLALDRGELFLWSVTVHESGAYSFGQTILYFAHFLREVPTIVALVLFVVATYAEPTWPRRNAKVITVDRRLGVVTALGAILLVAVALVVVSKQQGAGEAVRNLSQLYTRDGVAEYGSHWRYHFLSSLWFGLATPIVAWIGWRFFGGPRPRWSVNSRPVIAAWLYFGFLSVLFGLGLDAFVDPRFIGHQAREIASHSMTTLPLSLGVYAFLERWRGSGASHGESGTPSRLAVAGFLVIPAYLGVLFVARDSIASGQVESGLASMIGAHYFEHVLDYVLAAFLVMALTAWGTQHARPLTQP